MNKGLGKLVCHIMDGNLEHPMDLRNRKLLNRNEIDKDASTFRKLFEDCFHLHFEGLHRYAFTMVKENDSARDLVQAVFVKWWEGRSKIELRKDPQHYLYTSVRNHCLNYIRNNKNRKTFSVDFSEFSSKESERHSDPVLYKEFQVMIETVLSGLPPQCERIFRMSRFEEMKYAEIAKELDLSVKTIEVQIGKALKILRAKLGEMKLALPFIIMLSIYLK